MNNIVISNPQEFEKIKKQFQKSRLKKLHILSDFDRTMTRAFIDGGEHVPSLISILRSENYLVEGYSEKAYTLFNKYHAIELDDSISMQEKKKAMEQWWTKHSTLLIESGLNKKELAEVAKSKKLKFRLKTLETITILNEQEVPFVILSASGLGDESIIETLKYHKLYLPNVNVISNKYIWNKNGDAIGSITPHIHTFNKNETAIKDSPQIYDKIKTRKNVILLGDSLGDVGMVEGFEYDNLLKIGFLNSSVEEKIEEYKKNYDVVITNDGTMKFLYDFLKEMK